MVAASHIARTYDGLQWPCFEFLFQGASTARKCEHLHMRWLLLSFRRFASGARAQIIPRAHPAILIELRKIKEEDDLSTSQSPNWSQLLCYESVTCHRYYLMSFESPY